MSQAIQYAIPMPIDPSYPESKVLEEGPVGLAQNSTEFDWVLGHYKTLKPKSVVEVGTMLGGTLWFWIQYAEANAKIMALDLGQHSGTETWSKWAEGKGVMLFPLIGNSHDKSIAEKVEQFMAPIDFLFIDGDHTQDGFAQDFTNYWPMVRKGGVAVLHDIKENPSRPTIGCDKLWRRIKESGIRTEQLIVQYGTGVAFK